MENKNIDFVARHYRKGLFAADKALARMGIRYVRWWTPAKIAAAVAVFVVFGATAAILIRNTHYMPSNENVVHEETAPASVAEIKVIDFEDIPLTAVVEKIKEVYGVEISGLPENAGDMRLSLHYEGTAADLVETINDILGTEMEISGK